MDASISRSQAPLRVTLMMYDHHGFGDESGGDAPRNILKIPPPRPGVLFTAVAGDLRKPFSYTAQ